MAQSLMRYSFYFIVALAFYYDILVRVPDADCVMKPGKYFTFHKV